MAKIFLLCGKICSGKTYYARQLKGKYSAVILSTDEVTFDLIENEQGEYYNVFAERVNLYLRKRRLKYVRQEQMLFWTGDFGQTKTDGIFRII